MQLLNFAVLYILCNITGSFAIENTYDNETIDGKNYFVFYTPVDWFEAWATCRYFGSYLVDVLTEQENNRIRSLIKKYNFRSSNFWMASIDLGDISHYYWVTNGQHLGYDNWAPGEPNNNNGEEHCVHYWDKHDLKWKDEKCEEAMRFICRDTPDVPMVGVAIFRRKQNKPQRSEHEETGSKHYQI